MRPDCLFHEYNWFLGPLCRQKIFSIQYINIPVGSVFCGIFTPFLTNPPLRHEAEALQPRFKGKRWCQRCKIPMTFSATVFSAAAAFFSIHHNPNYPPWKQKNSPLKIGRNWFSGVPTTSIFRSPNLAGSVSARINLEVFSSFPCWIHGKIVYLPTNWSQKNQPFMDLHGSYEQLEDPRGVSTWLIYKGKHRHTTFPWIHHGCCSNKSFLTTRERFYLWFRAPFWFRAPNGQVIELLSVGSAFGR